MLTINEHINIVFRTTEFLYNVAIKVYQVFILFLAHQLENRRVGASYLPVHQYANFTCRTAKRIMIKFRIAGRNNRHRHDGGGTCGKGNRIIVIHNETSYAVGRTRRVNIPADRLLK